MYRQSHWLTIWQLIISHPTLVYIQFKIYVLIFLTSSPFSDWQLCSASLFSFPAWLVNTDWDHQHDRRTLHLQPQGRGADLPCLSWWHRVSHRNVWNREVVGLWLLQQEVVITLSVCVSFMFMHIEVSWCVDLLPFTHFFPSLFTLSDLFHLIL